MDLWIFFLICCSSFLFLHNVKLRLTLWIPNKALGEKSNSCLDLPPTIYSHLFYSKNRLRKLTLEKILKFYPSNISRCVCLGDNASISYISTTDVNIFCNHNINHFALVQSYLFIRRSSTNRLWMRVASYFRINLHKKGRIELYFYQF